MQEITLTRPEKDAEIRFKAETQGPKHNRLTPSSEDPHLKTPLQDALAKEAKCPQFSGNKKFWNPFRRSWKDFLRRLNVNEDTGRNTVLVETLRMHKDAWTCVQRNAREEAGEILEYKQLWEELDVAFALDAEIDRKQKWQNLRLHSAGRLNRADWCMFLVKFESLAKEFKISEDDTRQRFGQAAPNGLQSATSREKVRFHRLNISGFSPNVPHAVVQRFLERHFGKPEKLVRVDDADWLVFWVIREEMLKNLCLNGKTVYMGEQPATLVITQRGRSKVRSETGEFRRPQEKMGALPSQFKLHYSGALQKCKRRSKTSRIWKTPRPRTTWREEMPISTTPPTIMTPPPRSQQPSMSRDPSQKHTGRAEEYPPTLPRCPECKKLH